MNNPENLQKLADSSFESENYELAYNYYNRLLESDMENPNNWLNKGYCAAYLSTIDKMIIKEALMSIKTAISLSSYSDNEITRIANELSTIVFDKIVEGVESIENEINRQFNALQIPAGTLYAVSKMRKVPIQFKIWGKYNEKLFQYFKIMDFIVRLKPTSISCEKGYRSVNYTTYVARNSGDHFYKLDEESNESKLLRELLQFSKNELNKKDPNNEVTNPKSSGCFIATATMGNYNHPIVIELRNFRDNWLLKRTWGVNFTNWYYKNSPSVANIIKDSIFLKSLSFILIVIPLYVISKMISDTKS